MTFIIVLFILLIKRWLRATAQREPGCGALSSEVPPAPEAGPCSCAGLHGEVAGVVCTPQAPGSVCFLVQRSSPPERQALRCPELCPACSWHSSIICRKKMRLPLFKELVENVNVN